ncbi:MAG: sodium/proline symporter [Planctomycetota bacterium]|jgi:sodium/proline symporter
MDRSTAILITLVVYKIVLIGIGFFARSRATTKEDFFLGGRKLGPLVAAISASASSSSAWTLLGLSGYAYSKGLSAIWFFPSCVGGFILNWYIVAPAMRRYVKGRSVLTVTDILVGDRSRPMAKAVATFASLLIVGLFTVYVASQFQGAGKTFAASFEGMSANTAVILGASIVLLYTLMGGFWAVSLTDTLQGLMMALTAIVLPTAALMAVGPGELLGEMRKVADPNYWNLYAGRGLASGLGFVVGVFGIGMAYPGQPHVTNRFIALDDRPEALVSARRIAILWAVIIYTGMILLGWCGRALFGEVVDNEGILITAANRLLNPVLAGVMIAAVLSAIMSTADSQLLVAASAIVHDLRWKAAAERPLFYSRLIITAISVLALIVVFWGSDSIFKQVLFAFSAAGAAFGPPLLALCLGWKPSPTRIFMAMVTGVSLVLFAKFVIDESSWKAHTMFFEYALPTVVSALLVFTSKRGAE